jgi:hypothetical protein
MTMTTAEAAGKVLEFIRNHREAFEMDAWSGYEYHSLRSNDVPDGHVIRLESIDQEYTQCGTTLCVAGFAAMATGWTQRIVKQADTRNDHTWYDMNWINPEGRMVEERCIPFTTIGRDYLGLTEHQANVIFFTYNRSTVEDWMHRLANGEDPSFLNDEFGSGECFDCIYCQTDEYEED